MFTFVFKSGFSAGAIKNVSSFFNEKSGVKMLGLRVLFNIWLTELAWDRVNLVYMNYMICKTFCIVQVGPDGLGVLKYLSNCQF